MLGPLEVLEGNEPVGLGGARQRAVLAYLLINRGEAVSVDRIVDALWGESPPATATKTVQVYVSRLRKILGAEALATRGHGYALIAEPDSVDADRFERLAVEGRERLAAGDARGAAERLQEALALWRGEPLADVAYESFAGTEASRLEDLRLAALEDRIDAELALGRHAALVPELEALVKEHPTRERVRGQLMLALYRSGRQTDALEAYREGRSAARGRARPRAGARAAATRARDPEPGPGARSPVPAGSARRDPTRPRRAARDRRRAAAARGGRGGLGRPERRGRPGPRRAELARRDRSRLERARDDGAHGRRSGRGGRRWEVRVGCQPRRRHGVEGRRREPDGRGDALSGHQRRGPRGRRRRGVDRRHPAREPRSPGPRFPGGRALGAGGPRRRRFSERRSQTRWPSARARSGWAADTRPWPGCTRETLEMVDDVPVGNDPVALETGRRRGVGRRPGRRDARSHRSPIGQRGHLGDAGGPVPGCAGAGRRRRLGRQRAKATPSRVSIPRTERSRR